MRFRVLFFLIFVIPASSFGQEDRPENDTTDYRVEVSPPEDGFTEFDPKADSWIRRNPYRGLIAPVALVGLGVLMIDNPVYDRRNFHEDVYDPEFGGSDIDDYLIYTPYVGLVALNLAKIPCQNDFINTSLIILKAELVNVALTFGLKRALGVRRPDGSNNEAFPSGHTSEAFLAATIVNREYRDRGPWVGIVSYGVASTVGLFRILNNKHWVSDVLAGAGIGIFSANLVYLTHQWRWGRPGTCIVPTMINGKPGVHLAYSF